MLSALKAYAHGSDVDVFLITRDLEYGIQEATTDHNVLHTLLFFKYYELPWLQNDASGLAKPGWFSGVNNTDDCPKLPLRATAGLVYRDNAYKGTKFELDYANVNRPLSTTWRPKKSTDPILLPKGAPAIYFGGVDSCEGKRSEFEVVLPRFCSYKSDGATVRVDGYQAAQFQCEILVSWLPLLDFLADPSLPDDRVDDLFEEGGAVDTLGDLLDVRPCQGSFYAKRVAEGEDYVVVNLFGEGPWERFNGDVARVKNTVFVIKKPPRKRRRLSTAGKLIDHVHSVGKNS